MSALNDLANFISTVSKETNENPEGIISSVLLLEKAGMTSITKAMENFSEAPKYFAVTMDAYSNFVDRSHQNWGETFKEFIERQKKITEKIEETKSALKAEIKNVGENIKTAENNIKECVGENFEKYLGKGSEILQKLGNIDTKIDTAKEEIETHIDNNFTNYLGEGSKISQALDEIGKKVEEHDKKTKRKLRALFTKHGSLENNLKEIKDDTKTIKESIETTKKILEEYYQQIPQNIDSKLEAGGFKIFAKRFGKDEKLEKKEEDFVHGLKELLKEYSHVEEISSIAREYQKIEKCLEKAELNLKNYKEYIDENTYNYYNLEIEKLRKEFVDIAKNLHSSIQEYENRKEDKEYLAKLNNYTESLEKLNQKCGEINSDVLLYLCRNKQKVSKNLTKIWRNKI